MKTNYQPGLRISEQDFRILTRIAEDYAPHEGYSVSLPKDDPKERIFRDKLVGGKKI
jgi:hypothetical protein